MTITATGQGKQETCKQFSDHVKSAILMVKTRFSGNPGEQAPDKVDGNVMSEVIFGLGL